MKFEWDPEKNKINIEKHNVSFREAQTIFINEYIETPDIDHSEEEERFIALGVSAFKRELIVCYCYRTKVNNETIIRIFSARKANKKERMDYYERR